MKEKNETSMNAVDETSVTKLSSQHNCTWPNIDHARESANEGTNKIKSCLIELKILRPETSLVVFGSLARGERTEGSDVDWTLLVDGNANTDDLKIAHAISDMLSKNNFGNPNPSGAFGNLSFSPDLIHQIGGETDTNANTTRRILLLLESASIGDDLVRDRVLRSVLSRYLSEDTPFRDGTVTNRTPRFLLNDIVRFWRTMAVDFACKQYQRGGKGWALRNAKLRLSRKLIFVSGLLMCYRFHRDVELSIHSEMEEVIPGLINLLMRDVNRTPLEVVAQSMIEMQIDRKIICDIFDSYDAFLGILNDTELRNRLGLLNYEDARKDNDFDNVRTISNTFQNALTSLFFKSNDSLRDWISEYGIF